MTQQTQRENKEKDVKEEKDKTKQWQETEDAKKKQYRKQKEDRERRKRKKIENEEGDEEKRQRKKGRLTTPVAFDFREESEGRRHRPANRPGVPTRKTTPVVCFTADSPSHPHRACARSPWIPREIRGGGDNGGVGDGGPWYFKGRQDFLTQQDYAYLDLVV